MHRPKPSKPHQLRDPAHIIAIRLHRHRTERITHVTRLQRLDRQPGLRRSATQTLRQ
jgi:hypothetical protein